MKWLATLLIFGGYMLVYAAIAGVDPNTGGRGRFVSEPWAGLFADAYTS